MIAGFQLFERFYFLSLLPPLEYIRGTVYIFLVGKRATMPLDTEVCLSAIAAPVVVAGPA